MNKQLNNDELLNIIAEQATETSKILKTQEKLLSLHSEKLKELQDDLIYIKKGRWQSGMNKETTEISEDTLLKKIEASTQMMQRFSSDYYETSKSLNIRSNEILDQIIKVERDVISLYHKQKMQIALLVVSILCMISLGGNYFLHKKFKEQRVLFEKEKADNTTYLNFFKYVSRKEPKLIENYIKKYNENSTEINAETEALENK